MFVFTLIAAPVLGAIIGWLTNRLAIKMLFYPRQPRRFLGLTWQGLIPRRHVEIADKTADLVADELIGQHRIRAEIEALDLGPSIDETVSNLVWNRLAPRLRAIPFIGNFVNDKLLTQLHTMAAEELHLEMPKIRERMATLAESQLDLRTLVRERILAFELEKLEDVIWQLAAREFRQIEWLGAVVGGLIGCVQALLFALAASSLG